MATIGKLGNGEASRLCKCTLFQRFLQLWDSLASDDMKEQTVKSSNGTDVPVVEEEEVPAVPVSKKGKSRKKSKIPGILPFEIDTSSMVVIDESVSQSTSVSLRQDYSYGEIKDLAVNYQLAKIAFIKHFGDNYGGWVKKPQEQNNFYV